MTHPLPPFYHRFPRSPSLLPSLPPLYRLCTRSTFSLCSTHCSPLFSGLGRQLSHSDSVSEHSPSIFPEHIHPLSSRDQPQHLLHQSGSGLPRLSHLSDQLVPDTSCKDGGPQPSGKDLEDLRLAISQLRAERQAQMQQQQQFDSQAELSINPLKSFLPNPVSTSSRHTTPPLRPTESAPLNPGKKAVAATLEFIHSALQTELEDELRETEAEGWRSRERREQRDGTPVRKVGSVGGNLGPSNSDTSITSSHPNTAAVTEPSNQTDATSDRREKADQHGAAYSSNSCPAEGDTSRLVNHKWLLMTVECLGKSVFVFILKYDYCCPVYELRNEL